MIRIKLETENRSVVGKSIYSEQIKRRQIIFSTEADYQENENAHEITMSKENSKHMKIDAVVVSGKEEKVMLGQLANTDWFKLGFGGEEKNINLDSKHETSFPDLVYEGKYPLIAYLRPWLSKQTQVTIANFSEPTAKSVCLEINKKFFSFVKFFSLKEPECRKRIDASSVAMIMTDSDENVFLQECKDSAPLKKQKDIETLSVKKIPINWLKSILKYKPH